MPVPIVATVLEYRLGFRVAGRKTSGAQTAGAQTAVVDLFPRACRLGTAFDSSSGHETNRYHRFTCFNLDFEAPRKVRENRK